MMTVNEICKVVIIDDDYTATEDLKKGLAVYSDMLIKGTAVNGAKGRKMIMEQRPDLLFLDIELPDMLGIRLLSDMRDEVVWDMKVVFYTAYDKYLLQALRESAFDYLLKPFTVIINHKNIYMEYIQKHKFLSVVHRQVFLFQNKSSLPYFFD